jgi:hypothetical protein
MKKIITLLTLVVMFSFQACTVADTEPTYTDSDTISTVYENSTYYNFTSSNNYTATFYFPYSIYSTDMVLVYRLSGTDNGKDVWDFLPETHYFSDGTRDFSYKFDFTYTDVQIYLEGNDLGSVADSYRLDQIFRIVVVPADLIYGVDTNDYSSVMTTLSKNKTTVQTIKF